MYWTRGDKIEEDRAWQAVREISSGQLQDKSKGESNSTSILIILHQEGKQLRTILK
jgi:hypothetical protein